MDWYRRQRTFPRRSFWLMTVLARSMLNSVMMCVYPLQTGTLHVVLLARRRPQLLALAAALDDACTALGDVLVQNAEARWAFVRGCGGVWGQACTWKTRRSVAT